MSGGDPGRQYVVGVIGEVVADEGVEQVMVAVEVRGGDGDELPVTRRGRVRRRARQQPSVTVAGDQRGGHEQGRCIAGARAGQTAATAAWSPLISRRSSVSVSSGMYVSIGAGADAGLTPN